MRNYIPKKNNLYKLPHNTYMQIFYMLRDYLRIKKDVVNNKAGVAIYKIVQAIKETSIIMEQEYSKRPSTYGKLDSYHAFFDYNYYSYMFARKNSEYGASKSAWSLYKSKFAYLLAEKLQMI